MQIDFKFILFYSPLLNTLLAQRNEQLFLLSGLIPDILGQVMVLLFCPLIFYSKQFEYGVSLLYFYIYFINIEYCIQFIFNYLSSETFVLYSSAVNTFYELSHFLCVSFATFYLVSKSFYFKSVWFLKVAVHYTCDGIFFECSLLYQVHYRVCYHNPSLLLVSIFLHLFKGIFQDFFKTDYRRALYLD